MTLQRMEQICRLEQCLSEATKNQATKSEVCSLENDVNIGMAFFMKKP